MKMSSGMNKPLKYGLIFAGSFIVTEVCYKLYKYLNYKWGNSMENSEVFFINESTQHMCEYEESSEECVFRNCGIKNIDRVTGLIRSATKSIDLAMYIITQWDTCRALEQAVRNKVKVRIICDNEMKSFSSTQVKTLLRSGAEVRIRPDSGLMHHKFCIIDAGCPNAVLLNGSLNWTLQGFLRNYENMLITSNRKIVKSYSDEFERLWSVFEKPPENVENEENREVKSRKGNSNKKGNFPKKAKEKCG